jgi:polyisoprenoid-binding protein YceI
MRILSLFLAAIVTLHRTSEAQPATFASFAVAPGLTVQRFDIDAAHSALEFSVRFMGLSRVRGAFSTFGGTLMYDSTDISRSSVSVFVSAASINTNVASRDRDLKGPAFFDTEKFPRIFFTSTRVERTDGGFLVRGPLTMHGVTREVAIPFTLLHPLTKDAWENRRIGFSGALTVKRREFGILGSAFWNNEFDPGRLSISDDVSIELLLSAEINNVDRWGTPKGDSLRAAAERQGLAETLRAFREAARDTASDAGRFSDEILGGAAMKLMHHHRFADAVAIYQLAAELKPERPSLHAALGEAQLLSGKRADAIASFRRALARDSIYTVAFEYLRRLDGKP